MNLAALKGKSVCVQFKPGCAWLACLVEGGKAVPMTSADGTSFAPLPFIIGDVVELAPDVYAVRVQNEAAPGGQKMDIVLSPESMFLLTTPVEERVVRLS